MEIDKNKFLEVLRSSVNNLLNHKEEVNALNVFPVPDGDTGTNMSLTIQSALREVEGSDASSLADLAKAAAKGSLMGARGNSGVILSQYFRGLSEGLGEVEVLDNQALAKALTTASKTTYNAVMKPTEGTILTVGRETGEFARRHSQNVKDRGAFLEEVLKAAKKSLENTPNLLAVLKEAGVVDAGGQGLYYILEGGFLALEGRPVASLATNVEVQAPRKESSRQKISTDDIQFGYCTEFMIETESKDVDGFRNKLKDLGDCLLVVGGEGLIKTHIHTNHPGKALEYAVELGQLKDIKIDNMRFQHEEVLLKEELDELRAKDLLDGDLHPKMEEKKDLKDQGFLAVSMGDGLSQVFKEIQVDQVLAGGQTMNPSTEDFISALDKIDARTIFILPNNSNIIMAANQAKEISEKDVRVIPSKTIPQGIAAMLAYHDDEEADENEKAMIEALGDIKSGSLTYAVRDTTVHDQKIAKDDYIGLNEKDIVANGKDLDQTVLALIDDLVDEDSFMVSLYRGEDVSEDQGDQMREKVEEAHPDLDVEVIYGGQPLYYYLISVE